VLNAIASELPPGDPELEAAILTQWNELFRTGLLSWGVDLSNPNPPFFHLTDMGRKALEHATRDPSNPAGYMRHLKTLVPVLNQIAESYVVEAIDCYVAGLFKAAAVMVGAAAEVVILELRDIVVEMFEKNGTRVPSELKSWKVKNVTDALTGVFSQIDPSQDRELRAKFDARWGALTHEIRTTRNDAGHPTSIDPVTPDSVHASLLILPILLNLSYELSHWAAKNL
jgi:hypothetical protein